MAPNLAINCPFNPFLASASTEPHCSFRGGVIVDVGVFYSVDPGLVFESIIDDVAPEEHIPSCQSSNLVLEELVLKQAPSAHFQSVVGG